MARKPGKPGPGHNGGPSIPSGPDSVARLRSLIERVERLEEEKAALASDIKDIFAEAKSAGFDTKVMKGIIKERKSDSNALAEYIALMDTYRRALGMEPIGL